MGRAADLVDAHVRETLTYYTFPDCHWIKIRTNNPLERIMREIRRRTRVVGAFPDGQSCLNLAAARLRHIAGTQWSTRKYMNMAPLRAAEPKPTEPSSREQKCERVWTLPEARKARPEGSRRALDGEILQGQAIGGRRETRRHRHPDVILLAHHLKTLKLPTFLREYENSLASAPPRGSTMSASSPGWWSWS